MLFGRKFADISDFEIKLWSIALVIFTIPDVFYGAYLQHYNGLMKQQIEAIKKETEEIKDRME